MPHEHTKQGDQECPAITTAAVTALRHQEKAHLLWDVAELDHRETHDFLIKQKRSRNEMSLQKAERTQPSAAVNKNILEELHFLPSNTRKYWFSFWSSCPFSAVTLLRIRIPLHKGGICCLFWKPRGWQGALLTLYLFELTQSPFTQS